MISYNINLLNHLNHKSRVEEAGNEKVARKHIKFYYGNLYSRIHPRLLSLHCVAQHAKILRDDVRHLFDMTMKLNINPHDDFLVIETAHSIYWI
jgi:hypothetical protein